VIDSRFGFTVGTVGERYQKLARMHRQSVALAATLATRLRLTPSSKLDNRTPLDGELPVG
jgi:hypothetical protein